MASLIEHFKAAIVRGDVDPMSWERTTFADPVVEALYQAGKDNCFDGMTTLDAMSDPEEIVAIVRAAIAQYAEDLSA